jgi:hypothetical protein
MSSLLQRVVLTSGISELFAENAVTRACERAGVDPRALSPATLKVALPEIEKAVKTFCHGQAEQIMPRLFLLTRP